MTCSSFSTVVVVGLGNLGSHTIETLARLPSIQRVLKVDPDSYAATNRKSQRIRVHEVGQPKALVQARRLRALHPTLEVIPMVEDIAHVPAGWLRGAIVLGCVDSIRSRNAINEAVWRAGAVWIDGGVEPASGLARVSVFGPGPEAPCFECGLEPEDYAALPARHLCAAPAPAADPAPTNGSFALGSLCAALMMMELENLLTAGLARSLVGRQLLVETRQHTQFNTCLTRNPACRFHHHTCAIQPLPGVTERSSVRNALAAAQRLLDSGRAVSLSLPGFAFARALHCPGGCVTTSAFTLPGRLPARRGRCAQCGRALMAAGMDLQEQLTPSALTRIILRRPLRALGLRAGDVLTASDGQREVAVEIPLADGSLVGALSDRTQANRTGLNGPKES